MNTKLNEILGYLDGVRADVYKALEALSQEQLDHQPAGGQWSTGEILHHLYVVEKGLPRLYMMLLKKGEEDGFKPEPNQDSQLGSLDRFELDVVKEKMTAPERVLPTAQVSKEELKTSLEESRKAVREVVNGVGEWDLSDLKWAHPFLGEINFYQWVLFVGKHEERHLKQIRRATNFTNYHE